MKTVRVVMECGQIAYISMKRYDSNHLDVCIENSGHFGGNMINSAWIRLSMQNVEKLISDIDKFLTNAITSRKNIITNVSNDGNYYITTEANHYTNNDLEIVVANTSRINSTITNEAFIRLNKSDATVLKNSILVALDE